MNELGHAFLSVAAAHLKVTLARRLIWIALVVQPLVIATTAYFLYGRVSGHDYATYVLLGGGMAGVWSTMTFSSASDLNRERYYGTLSSLVASRTPLFFTFTAKITANALLSLFAPALNILYGKFVLGITLDVGHPEDIVLGLFAFLFGTSAFALALSTLFLLSRSTQVFMNSLEYGFTLLGGLAFPITVLPSWIQPFSRLLPLTWGMEAIRLAFGQTELALDYYIALLGCLLLGCLYYALSLVLFRRIENRVRRDATLDFF